MSPPKEVVENMEGMLELNKPVSLVGGRIAHYQPAWRQISSDPWLLTNIRGVQIPFVEEPVQVREPSPFRLSVVESEAVD